MYCNQSFADMAKADLRKIMGTSLPKYFAGRDAATIATALHDGPISTTRVRALLLTRTGESVPVSVAMHPHHGWANTGIIITVVSDLTEIVAAQEAIGQVNHSLELANRSLRMLNTCNTIIIRATDEQQLLWDTCNSLVDVGGYTLAWIGYVEHDEAKSVRPVAWNDSDGDYVASVRVSWGDSELGGGPAGRAIRDGHAIVMRDAATDPTFAPWRELAQRDGLRSSAAIPLRDGNGVFGILAVYSDRPGAFDENELALLTELADDIAYCITNLRRAAKLAETRALLDNILQSSTKYSIISEDLDRKILFWNEGARRNYGYTADEVAGKTEHILETPEDRASGATERLAEIARDNGIVEGELQRIRKDGSRFPANVVVTCRSDAAGNLVGYLVISSDISEKRQAEEKLQAASQYARSLIEANLDPMVTISPDGKITDINHGTELITGRRREHLIDTDFAMYFTEPEKARSGYQRVFAKGFLIDYPLAFRHVAGTGDGSVVQRQPVLRSKRHSGRRVPGRARHLPIVIPRHEPGGNTPLGVLALFWLRARNHYGLCRRSSDIAVCAGLATSAAGHGRHQPNHGDQCAATVIAHGGNPRRSTRPRLDTATTGGNRRCTRLQANLCYRVAKPQPRTYCQSGPDDRICQPTFRTGQWQLRPGEAGNSQSDSGAIGCHHMPDRRSCGLADRPADDELGQRRLGAGKFRRSDHRNETGGVGYCRDLGA